MERVRNKETIGAVLNHMSMTSAELTIWRADAGFRAVEAYTRSAAISPALATDVLRSKALVAALGMADDAEHAPHARDRITARKLILEVSSVLQVASSKGDTTNYVWTSFEGPVQINQGPAAVLPVTPSREELTE